jgi:nicotinamidase-related amidase/RimJ/RimL family protein N-acetyltransferase
MITLRVLLPEDIPFIKSWPPYPPEFSELDYSLRDDGWLDEYCRKAGTSILIAEDHDRIIGFSILSKCESGSAEFRIALHPDNLGKGMGKTITLLTLRQGFSDPAISTIRLIVRKSNPRARKLYEMVRFRNTGEYTLEIMGKPVEFFTMVIERKTFFYGEFDMKEVLLVIDVQNEYFTGKLPVTYPAKSFEKIQMAMDHAHAARIPVVVIQHTNPAPEAATFKKGTDGWELHDEIKRRHADIIIEKTLPGSFTATMLDTWLKENTISTITIAGYMTQMCCDTTARQAFHRGYTVNFLSDATGTLAITNSAGSVTDEELHRAILVTQAMRFSRVMPTSEWMKDSKK